MASKKVDIGIDVDVKGDQKVAMLNDKLKKTGRAGKEAADGLDKAAKGAKGAGSAAGKSARGFDRAAKAAKRAGVATKKMATSMQGLAVGGGIVAAGAAIAAFSKESLALFAVQEKAEAQLAATIKSTGSAAGVTAKEMREYAGSLQGLTTFGDEAIIGAESLLLTFTNIGGPVIKQATATVLDMSQALGQDLKSSSVQLGKALNDPILGITALSRVGVSFTEQQKEMIKSMVEMGDVTGAQQIILAELGKEFGGSAAAAVDTFDGKVTQLSNTFGDFQEEIGEAIAMQGGFVSGMEKQLGVLTSNTAMWNTLQKAMDEGAISQEALSKAHGEGNEALAALADEYLTYIDALTLGTAQAESSDIVLRGLADSTFELADGWGKVSEAESENMRVASEAAFANSELSDKVQQVGQQMTEAEALIYNANAAIRDTGAATSEAAGPLAAGVSLTERINQEIERLANQPKSFTFDLDVTGLGKLREGVGLMAQMGGGIDFDPFATGNDAGRTQNQGDDSLDRGNDQGNPGGAGSGTERNDANFAQGVSDFKVPPGFANDSFSIGVSSGETVNVAPEGESGGGGIGGVTFNVYTTNEQAGMAVKSGVMDAFRELGIKGFG